MSEKRTIEEIQTSLWDMANKLRGTMDASEYKNYPLAILDRYLLIVIHLENKLFH